MVSRRNLVTVLLMMGTIFFMFQFTQVVKVRNNRYDTNEYVKESSQSADGRYTASEGDGYIVYFGQADTERYEAAKEWCDYTKRNLVSYKSFSDASEAKVSKSEMILIDAETSDCFDESQKIVEMAEYQVPMVFVTMPEPGELKHSYRLREILGISRIREDSVTAEGFQVFEGFLLGGEAAYKPQKEEEKKYNDLNLSFPWYETGAGSKTYAVGMMDEEEYKANEFPKLLWRNNYNGTFVYAVCADLINEETGMGFLSAIEYSAKDYVLYPVVNAQNMVLSDYPTITEENTDSIKGIYSMDALTLSRDITWPVIVSIANRYNLKMTCFVNTGYNYPDKNHPSEEYLEFYQQQVKEINGEIGRSLDSRDYEAQFKSKTRDDEFFFEFEKDYHFASAYVPHMSDDVTSRIEEDNRFLSRINTVISNKDDNETLSYISDKVTLQSITNVADEYTYSKELKHRCMLTSIGYATTLIDMHKVQFPEKTDDEWQVYSKLITSNLNTYWTANDEFEYTAVSQSDNRVRDFLNLDYETKKEDDRIKISTENVDEAYFVLRTHNEDILKVVNADYTKIEKDAYLIKVKGADAEIVLSADKEVLKYDGMLK